MDISDKMQRELDKKTQSPVYEEMMQCISIARKLAEQGTEEGMYKAMRWYKYAWKLGSVSSGFEYCRAMLYGACGVKQNIDKAVQFFSSVIYSKEVDYQIDYEAKRSAARILSAFFKNELNKYTSEFMKYTDINFDENNLARFTTSEQANDFIKINYENILNAESDFEQELLEELNHFGYEVGEVEYEAYMERFADIDIDFKDEFRIKYYALCNAVGEKVKVIINADESKKIVGCLDEVTKLFVYLIPYEESETLIKIPIDDISGFEILSSD